MLPVDAPPKRWLLEERSEAVLAKVNPALAAKVRAAAGELEKAGTYLLVVSGLRTGGRAEHPLRAGTRRQSRPHCYQGEGRFFDA